MIPISIIISGRAFVETIAEKADPASTVGALIGGGLSVFAGIGFSLSMTIICLIGFLISFLIGREMKSEES